LSPVQLDGSLADAQFKCDLLVQASRYHQAHDLALARRQRIEALTKFLDLGALRARFAIHLQRLPDRIHELGFPHRLGKEMNGAGLESLYRHGYVAAAREEDHRHTNAGDVHFPLQLQAIHARHVDVQNHTPGHRARVAVHELGGR